MIKFKFREQYKNFTFLLDLGDKKRLIIIFFLSLIAVFLELFGVGLVIPLMALISTEGLNEFFNLVPALEKYFFNISKINLMSYFLIFIVIFFLFKSVFTVFLTWIKKKFILYLSVKISSRLLNHYLKKNMSYHSNMNSSEILRNVDHETHTLTSSYFTAITDLALDFLISLCLISMMIYLNFIETLIIFLLLTTISIFHFYFVKKKLLTLGEERIFNSSKIIQIVNQSVSLIKEIQIFNKISQVTNKFKSYQKKNANILVYDEIVSFLPGVYFELLAVLSICLVLFFSILNGMNISATITKVGVFAAIAFKLMPVLKRVLSTINNILHHAPSLNIIFNDIIYKDEEFKRIEPDLKIKNFFENNSYESNKKIELENLSFYYKDKNFDDYKNYIFDKTNLEISFNSITGIVGTSGSGKSTFISLICGFLEPHKGNLKVGEDKFENISQINKYIGYVSQHTNLIDDNIVKNICLEEDENKIDIKKVNHLIEYLELDKVINKFPKGISTKLGEQGLKFSGGQRQKIAIARALYLERKILIFDESTSSLDSINEKLIFDLINKIKKDKIVIFISHRPSIYSFADKVYEIINKEFVLKK